MEAILYEINGKHNNKRRGIEGNSDFGNVRSESVVTADGTATYSLGKVYRSMNKQDDRESVVIVHLLHQRQQQVELQRIIEHVSARNDCDVVVDFSDSDAAGGAMLTQLLELRHLLHQGGHKLVLCSVAPAIRGVFTIVRLDEVFDFVKDRFAALAHIQTLV